MSSNYSENAAFQANYFFKNAFEKYTNSIQEFMFWHRGLFLPPHKKEQYIQQFMEEEQRRFYIEGVFSLPSVQFAITTRCTLRCRDCSVMIPHFGRDSHEHLDLTFLQFQRDFDSLLNSVDHIGTVLFLGGEPLLNKDLPQMLDYAAGKNKVDFVNVVTNCTKMPSTKLLDAVASFRHKVFFGLSNYSANSSLLSVLKREELIETLKKRGIKHTLDTGNQKWFKYELIKCNYSAAQLKSVFSGCIWHHCFFVLDGTLAVCPRSLIGHTLGAFELGVNDAISLRMSSSEEIRAGLVRFYEKDTFEACQYCRYAGVTGPAVQLE